MIEEMVWFESPALGRERQMVRRLEGEDRLNQEYRFDVEVVLPRRLLGAEELETLLGSPARIVFTEASRELNAYSGCISSVSAREDFENECTLLDLELGPRTTLAALRRGSEIFVGQSLPLVLREKLTAWGLTEGRDFLLSLHRVYPHREMIAQYEETELAFVRRLCERAGITTRYDELDGHETLVFSDQDGTAPDIGRPRVFARKRTDHPAAYEVRTVLRRVARDVTVGDYNYRSPKVSLRAQRTVPRPAAVGLWSEYGHHHKTPEESVALATMRAEEMASRFRRLELKTTEASFRAGGMFELVGGGGSVERLLATCVHFRFGAPSGESGERGFENEVEALPADVPFRPPHETPTPRVQGLLNAVVDGAIRGEYAELDDLGRYHLKLGVDPSSRTDLSATHPVRMMSPHSGPNYGMHFPLRPGAEVLVGFVHGDPDRPVIVGAAPTPLTSSPVARRNQTQNVLRTGGKNELLIEDALGSERIRLHSPHQSTTMQLGARDEAEEGVLFRTEAHVTAASRLSHNVLTSSQTTIARSSTTLAGRRAVWLAGFDSIDKAAQDGLEQPSALSIEGLRTDLAKLGGGRPRASSGGGDNPAAGPQRAPLQSDIASEAARRSEERALHLARSSLQATEEGMANAGGRVQGDALGVPGEPALIAASERLAAVIGGDTGMLRGDRVVAVSSAGTAALEGDRVVLVKSAGEVEVAGRKGVAITTESMLDVVAGSTQWITGYDPGVDIPRLDDGTSFGLMARQDLRLISVEDCVIFCAQKNLIGTAHDGDLRLQAGGSLALRGAEIRAEASQAAFKVSGTMTIKADGDLTVEAGGGLTLKASSVTIEAADIHCAGNLRVDGNLFVGGTRNF